jgi:hypothetical protein
VNKVNTLTTLTSSLNPARSGSNVTFTANVTAAVSGAGSPSGAVTFKDGPITLGTVSLSGGKAVFSTSKLTGGTHSITAVYGGDGNFNAGTSAVLSQSMK